MATPQLCDSSRLADGFCRDPLLATNIPPCRTCEATENHGGGNTRAESRAAGFSDPLMFYKTYLNTNIPLLGDQNDFDQDDDGYTCHPGAAAAQNAPVDDAQSQAKGHTAAYKLAVRLANRSNGAPLATIIEQGSCSTLNSHGSLLSVGRFPSIKAAENISPSRGSRRRSRSLDEKALHDIQEDLALENDTLAKIVPHARLQEEFKATDPATGTATPLTSYHSEPQHSPPSHSGNKMFSDDVRGVKGFIRGVLQNVRGVSRTRPRSSSMPHVPIMEHQKTLPPTHKRSPQLYQGDQDTEPVLLKYIWDISNRASKGAGVPPTPVDQTRNRTTSSLDFEDPAHPDERPLQSLSTLAESITLPGSRSPLLLRRAATRSHERPLSTPTVGSRDVALEDSTTQVSTFRRDISDNSARYTFDGVPVFRDCPSSLRNTGSARDVFRSQNASFCSTMSTSYSGTVLGVDLDLHHDFGHPIRHSQSPPTPVWFTPQMTELERQASHSESPESLKTCPATCTAYRSITSSALTSLLPVAEASGIVRPNYNTPKISFFSPSGNLIQPESVSSQDSRSSECVDSPIAPASHSSKQITNAALSSRSRPAGPLLVPMITPPSRKTLLPPHVRHNYSYHHPELSQTGSLDLSYAPMGPVRGCDGVVRENSLSPRSGVFYPHGKDKVHRSTKLVMHDLKAEAIFYKVRFLALARAHSFAAPKGRMLQKRHIHEYNTYARGIAGTADARKSGKEEDLLGPFTAHALRVCFCQPYDGAGKPTRATSASACVAGRPFSTQGKSKADRGIEEAERSLPNARIIGSTGRSKPGHIMKATTGGHRGKQHCSPSVTTGMAEREMRLRGF